METTTNSPNKKQKLDESDKKEPPPYGSQEYWEERYQKHRKVEKEGENGTDGEGDAVPYHQWYFTFSELSPLILPLILGSGSISHDREDESVDGNSRIDDDREGKQPEEQADTAVKDDSESVNPGENSPAAENDDVDNDNESDYLEGEEDEEEELKEREGLAKNGPISVIEIGCGDMPLGRDLALELAQFEKATGASADNIVKEIVCCDYSSTVIDLCKENQRQDLQARASKNGGGINCVEVDYVTADARKLPYPDSNFDLIMEKGTLDAMLSDKETGASNCTKIMADCARVLKEGGYILLVSHINAHTQNGIDWLDSVVITGLRNGAGTQSTWEIEVHGNDGTEDAEFGGLDEVDKAGDSGVVSENCEGPRTETIHAVVGNGEEADCSEDTREASDRDENDVREKSTTPPSGSPGPAVYIIHNLSKPAKTKQQENQNDDDPPTIPLKFFSY